MFNTKYLKVLFIIIFLISIILNLNLGLGYYNLKREIGYKYAEDLRYGIVPTLNSLDKILTRNKNLKQFNDYKILANYSNQLKFYEYRLDIGWVDNEFNTHFMAIRRDIQKLIETDDHEMRLVLNNQLQILVSELNKEINFLWNTINELSDLEMYYKLNTNGELRNRIGRNLDEIDQ